jgi:putative SOS response-associated peptidase YedK
LERAAGQSKQPPLPVLCTACPVVTLCSVCGRFYQDLLEEDLQEYFAAEAGEALDSASSGSQAHASLYAPRFNIAPGQQILVVRRAPSSPARRTTAPLDRDERRSLDALHWGLIPHFAKDKKGAYRCINARAETVDRTPTYRMAFQKRRCLVVAHGFYEWQTLGPKHKQPFAIAKRDRGPLALAGLWENWLDNSTGEWLRSVTIVTTEANDTLRVLHDRMPVVLEPAHFAAWLGEVTASPDQLKALLVPSTQAFELWPVDPRMNRVAVDDADILRPVLLPETQRAEKLP